MGPEPFNVRAAWAAATLERDRSWVFELTDAHQRELLDAIPAFKAWAHDTGMTAQWLHGHMQPTAGNFPLPTLAPQLRRFRSELEDGYGLVQLRRVPVKGLTPRDLHLLHAGLCAHVGTPRPQTVFGDVVQDLRDAGQASLIERRGSKHNRGLPFHNDPCDVVSFLCIAPAASGGIGQFVSSVAIHNALLASTPQHVSTLYDDFVHAYQEYLFVRTGANESSLPKQRFYHMPIFSAAQGVFACKYSRFYIDQAQESPRIPRLSPAQNAALDALDEQIANPQWRIEIAYEAGDMMLINNYVCFHARTPFTDDSRQRRHLLRIWLAVPNSRPLASQWAQHMFYQSTEAGAIRGGVPGPEPEYD